LEEAVKFNGVLRYLGFLFAAQTDTKKSGKTLKLVGGWRRFKDQAEVVLTNI